MPRQITYVIASEYPSGIYQGSFNWGVIGEALAFLENYWDVKFVRIGNYNAANYKFIQAKTNPNPSWAAWTNGNITRVNPQFNFGGGRYVAARVTIHEFMHYFGGGTNHSGDPAAIMSPNAGNLKIGNFVQDDYRWMRNAAWKSALRPHMEPWRMKNQFAPPTGAGDKEEINLQFKCGCQTSWLQNLWSWKSP